MRIALDWDNTFTKDTKLWQEFIHLFDDHFVYIVTSRDEDTPLEFIPEDIEGVIYCGYRAKKKVTEERGIQIDIWIDDDPFYITTGFIE